MSVTLGSSSAPSQVIKNLDSLFAQSLAAYKKELIDNIASSNPLLNILMKGEAYESQEGSEIQIPLMYALATMDWYDGYDELSTQPTDGITAAIYQWRQAAVPIAYSMKEMLQNKNKIVSLVKSRIKQSELGIKEGFATALFQGSFASGGTSILTPASSPVNGSTGVEPLGSLIRFDPTASASIGNISQSVNTWWRNKTKTSAATTYDGLLFEWMNIFDSCALGTGGKPTLIPTDQTSYELFYHAFFQKFRIINADMNFPFDNIMYRGARVVMEEKMPDAYTDAATTAIYGTAYFLNMQFWKLVYEADRDFVMLEDENGKSFQKPTNGDSRVGHIAWMGNTTISNRRKQGVLAKIARTLT